MFFQPRTVEEALELKAFHSQSAQFISGGTDLVVLMNQGKIKPDYLIDLSHLSPLRRVASSNGVLELGGAVTYARCISLPAICLSEAAASVGGPGIRELGTLAGNLATASPAGDGSTALLALDAQVELRSSRATRIIPMTDFFKGYRRTALASGEMISRILIPTGHRSAWMKIGKRSAMNISVAAAAVAITPAGQVRIALASVAPTPVRCYQAEEYLRQKGLDDATIDVAAQMIKQEISPISDHRASADYRTHIAGILVGRLLRRLTIQ